MPPHDTLKLTSQCDVRVVCDTYKTCTALSCFYRDEATRKAPIASQDLVLLGYKTYTVTRVDGHVATLDNVITAPLTQLTKLCVQCTRCVTQED